MSKLFPGEARKIGGTQLVNSVLSAHAPSGKSTLQLIKVPSDWTRQWLRVSKKLTWHTHQSHQQSFTGRLILCLCEQTSAITRKHETMILTVLHVVARDIGNALTSRLPLGTHVQYLNPSEADLNLIGQCNDSEFRRNRLGGLGAYTRVCWRGVFFHVHASKHLRDLAA